MYDNINLQELTLQTPSIFTGALKNTRDSTARNRAVQEMKPSYSKCNPGPGAFKQQKKRPGRPRGTTSQTSQPAKKSKRDDDCEESDSSDEDNHYDDDHHEEFDGYMIQKMHTALENLYILGNQNIDAKLIKENEL